MIRWPVVDPDHQLSFVGLNPDFNPQARNLCLTISQRQLFAVRRLFVIGSNSHTPLTLPLPSEKLIALSGAIQVTQIEES